MVQLALAPELAKKPLWIFIVVRYDTSERAEEIALYHHKESAIEFVERECGAIRLREVNGNLIYCCPDGGSIEIIESTVS